MSENNDVDQVDDQVESVDEATPEDAVEDVVEDTPADEASDQTDEDVTDEADDESEVEVTDEAADVEADAPQGWRQYRSRAPMRPRTSRSAFPTQMVTGTPWVRAVSMASSTTSSTRSMRVPVSGWRGSTSAT